MAETEITVSSEVSTGYHAMLDVIGASEPGSPAPSATSWPTSAASSS